MRLSKFEYLAPNTVEEAFTMMAENKAEASVMAGGTDLLNKMRDRVVTPSCIIGLRNISGLNYIEFDENSGLKIGALATLDDVSNTAIVQEKYPMLSEAIELMASPAVRNLGTVAGNICNAVPSADTAPPLLVLDASVKLASPAGERIVPLAEFFTGPTQTVIKGDELLIEIQVPAPATASGSVYKKHTIRKALDLAMIGVAAAVTVDSGVCKDIKIGLGAVAPTPLRAVKAEAILTGKILTDDLIQEAADAAAQEASPITDHRATAEYRREMVMVLTKRAVKEAFDRA